jgi:rhodanese-related sulfurtransferase
MACAPNYSDRQAASDPARQSASVQAQQDVTTDVQQRAYVYFKEFPADNNVIKADKLFSRMRAGEDLFIIDVRRPADYAKSHLKGAVNLSFFDTSIPDALERIPDDKPVMVHCYTGQTGAQVTTLLNIAGKTAKNIQSGFDNGISKTEGYAALLEQTANPLPEQAYSVSASVKDALAVYFKDKMALDGTPFANFNLTARTVKSIVDEKDDAYLILSVRQADDYAKGHIPTARNIPFGKGMEAGLVMLPKDKKIVVYCYTGQTASQTMVVLRMMGYDAYSMSGGMGAWTKEGFGVAASK